MKKVFDQTVRDLKREVNKKVLKVPGIEQKILDATSNEPWGPHGSHLADIAQATRNYHEYQMVMQVIWKRLNDTGKNWRHVYKALTVLEYLVGHGSERVIDDIREHAYQISTLSNFQYIDSSGKDQGSNVRRKSQSLVAVVNDKEKIQEVRQKAAANRDKYRSTYSTGGRHSSYAGGAGYAERYDDGFDSRHKDSYEGKYKDDDQNGGREREWGSRDDEKYGRGGDSYNRDGDRYGSRESDERYGRDSYKDDDYRGRRGNDDSQFGSRSKSLDGDRDRSFEEDDRYYPSRNGGRVDNSSQDERRLERKLSEQSSPPSYEEVTTDSNKYTQDESSRGAANSMPSATKAYSPPATIAVSPKSMGQSPNQPPSASKEADGFDEFDPRSSVPAASPTPASSSGIDLFAYQSSSDPVDSLALVPVSFITTSDADVPASSGVGTNFVPLSSASTALNQPSEDPFGDGQFKATPQQNFQAQQHSFTPGTSFHPSGFAQAAEPPAFKAEAAPSFDFGDSLGGLTYTPSFANDPPSVTTEFPTAQANNDIFGSSVPSASSGSVPPYAPQQPAGPTYMNTANSNYLPQPGPSTALAPQPAAAPYPQATPMHLYQPGLSIQPTPQTAAGQLAYVQPPKDKFETKSTVWADTLNRGLVNLNISGAKVNPLADIGVDFDSLNRVDKMKQKSSAAPPVSTVTMGKAMGSGSGIGRAGAGGVGPPLNPMMGSGMGMGRGMGMGMGMGGYGGGMRQPMGMGMNMGMNQGAPMRPPVPGPGMPGAGYNPMMGGYGSQQSYGGGYR